MTALPGTIRLLALDLDQTLFGDDLQVSPRVLGTVEQVQSRGVLVTIATGREARLAGRFARELRITSPIICSQGGCIYDMAADRVLKEVRLPRELLPRILGAAEQFSWNIHFEMSDRLFFPEKSNHPAVMFELLRYSNWVRVGNLLEAMPEAPHKFIVTLNRTEDREKVMGEMTTAFGNELSVISSHPHLVEGLPAGVDKGQGLAWLADHLGIERATVMAIGDSAADIPMLQWAGLGIAMGNASPEVKKVAGWVAPSLSENGASVAMERFILDQSS